MKISFLLLLFVSFFSGCHQQPKVQTVSVATPEWVSNPPSSEGEFIYGVGEGKDKESALASALSSVSSSLSVWVDSQFSSDTKVHEHNGDESYTKESEQKIALHVKQMHLGNYEIVNSQKLGFEHFAVLIKSDKKTLFTTLKNESEQSIASLKNEEKAMKDADILKRLEFYKKASQQALQLQSTALLLSALQPDFDTKTMVQAADDFQQSYSQLRSKISFDISSDSQSGELISALRDFISNQGFMIAKRSDDKHLHVNLNSQLLKSTFYGFKIVRATVSVEIKDSKEQTLRSKKIDIIGRSAKSFEAAEQNLAIKFRENINGIL